MIIHVDIKDRNYAITLENGALSRASQLLKLDRKVFIVTDSGVPKEYAEAIADKCGEAHIEVIFKGEQSKNICTLEKLIHEMLSFDMNRSDCVVAVGGGVVGDIAGFAASCYMRGIDFYNIPTTLLAQVDSSVGGKTGIDFDGVKNLVGAFYQPKEVIIDPLLLSTLPSRIFNEGAAEIIKMALTSDAELFEMLEKGCYTEEMIFRSLMIKKKIVEQDEKENGLRRVLNFGHTVGHAIESANKGNLLHGECVALGMLPMCSDEVRKRLVSVLKKYSLPVEISDKPSELLQFISHDKKNADDGITTVIVDAPGNFRFEKLSAEEILARVEAIK